MADEIVKALVLNGAKSSPYLYNSWLEMEDYYQDYDAYEDDETYEETNNMYNNIKNYLGLFNTINKLKNVRKRNRKAKTIQKRIRGNRSRLYNDRPTQYMRNIPKMAPKPKAKSPAKPKASAGKRPAAKPTPKPKVKAPAKPKVKPTPKPKVKAPAKPKAKSKSPKMGSAEGWADLRSRIKKAKEKEKKSRKTLPYTI